MARVWFLQDSGINESLAVADVAGLLRGRGHEVGLLLGDETPDPKRALRRSGADVVVIPCPVAGHVRALEDAEITRAALPDATILLGGTHATFAPELALRPEVDAVIVGEAEVPLLKVAERIDRGEAIDDVPSLALASGGELLRNPVAEPIQDLDGLPLPARDLYFAHDFLARLPWKKFATGRGCVHRCTYCWNTSLAALVEGKGQFVRRKSPERAIDEVVRVKERWPLRLVHFSDDLFTMHPAWLEEFADRYRRRVGLPFTCNTSVPLVTERTVAALVRAGCKGVAIGVETGNEVLRGAILGKEVSDAAVREAAGRIKRAGLQLITFNMVGSPGETVDDVISTIVLNRQIGTDRVRVNLAVPLAHTAFEETAFSLGFLPDDHTAGTADLRRPDLQLQTPDRDALVALYLLFRPAIHGAVPVRALRRLGRLPPRLLMPLRLAGVYEEKRITALTWREGMQFFAHVGDPRRRTANYVTLI